MEALNPDAQGRPLPTCGLFVDEEKTWPARLGGYQ